jgi:hypothetical protein
MPSMSICVRFLNIEALHQYLDGTSHLSMKSLFPPLLHSLLTNSFS